MAIKVTIIPSGRDEEPRELVFPKSEIRIGRGLYNDIVLDSLDVSTNHAILTVSETDAKKGLTISDLGSSSGTRLEGAPIPSRFAIQMSPSQRIEIGGFVIKVDFLSRGKELEISGQAARELKMKDLKDLVREPKESDLKEQALPFGFSQERHSVRDNWREALFEPAPPWAPPIADTSSGEKVIPAAEDPFDKTSRQNSPSSLFGTPRENIGALPSTRTASQTDNPVSSNVIYVSPEIENSEAKPVEAAPVPQLPTNEVEPAPVETPPPELSPENTRLGVESQTSKAKHAPEKDLTSKNISDPELGVTMDRISTNVSSNEIFQQEASSVLELGDMEIDAAVSYDIIGTVLAGGTPVEDVEVNGGSLGIRHTDSDGKFVFEQLTEGAEFSLTFEKPGYRFLPAQLSGKLESHQYKSISALELVELKGRVTRANQGLADVEVNAGSLGSVKTANDGSFSISGIPANSFLRVSFEKELFVIEPSGWEGVIGRNSPSLELHAVQFISLTGRLVRAGKPLSGIEIEGGHLGRAITGPDGRYTFYNVREDMQASLTPIPGGKSFSLQLVPKTS